MNLQATLSASSAIASSEAPTIPHHPITCTSALRYDDDGTFACEHSAVPPGDLRTQFCLDHSIALLLIELVRRP
jgi:hypothetical protein